MVTEPRDPSPSNVARQDQLVPQPTELLDVYVPPYVVIIAFTQNLLIHAETVSAVIEVVLLGRATPPDTQWQLHDAVCLLDGGAVDVVRNSDRSSAGTQGSAACRGHASTVYGAE